MSREKKSPFDSFSLDSYYSEIFNFLKSYNWNFNETGFMHSFFSQELATKIKYYLLECLFSRIILYLQVYKNLNQLFVIYHIIQK